MNAKIIDESMIRRAFEIVDELNRISKDLRGYTFSIREIDVTILGDPCQTNQFNLTVSKDIPRG